MITFIIAVFALLAGYWLYGSYVERVFGADSNLITPACSVKDGVDYVPMKWGKVFLIQFLNIAGLGPIFGAVAGALWGSVAFLWIVLGSIFAGAVHDYLSGMISLRMGGLSIPEVVGKMLGSEVKIFMRVFTVLLMIIVGAVFILGPAKILDGVTNQYFGITAWTLLVFAYYIIATLLPIDKVIGRVYPIFGAALLFMAAGIMLMLFVKGVPMPELSRESFRNMHNDPNTFRIFPMLFITIACGAISGFHATQSPLMARCLENETQGRKVFYGAMIAEGLVALIWAAAAIAFFGGVEKLNEVFVANNGNAAWVVNEISTGLMGKVGAVLVLLGVVAAPITSGDTAFRSARLIVADFLKVNQTLMKNRLLISIPLFLIGYFLTTLNFDVIWRYFAWSNQTLAMVVLWALSVWLLKEKRNYWITLIPAAFMTVVTFTYIMVAPEGFSLTYHLGLKIGLLVMFAFVVLFFIRKRKK